MATNNSEKGGFLRRLISSFSSLMKNSMSNNQLRWNLYEALKGSVRGLDYVYDEDPEAKTVKYCVVIRYGDGWEYSDYDYRWFQRTYEVDAEGNITLNDDAVEIEAVSDEWVPAKDQSMTKAINSASAESDTKTCTCNTTDTEKECTCMKDKTDNQMEEMTMSATSTSSGSTWKKEAITRLIASGAYKGLDEKTLNTLSDETLTSMLKVAEKAEKEGKEVKEAKVEDGKVTVVVAEKKTEEKMEKTPEVKTSAETVLTEEQLMKAAPPHLRDMIAKYKAAEEDHRSSLITSLKDSSAFDEKELNEMPTPMLEKVAKTAGIDQQITASSSYDYSGRGLPVSAPIDSGTKKGKGAPDTWAISAATHNKKNKDEATN